MEEMKRFWHWKAAWSVANGRQSGTHSSWSFKGIVHLSMCVYVCQYPDDRCIVHHQISCSFTLIKNGTKAVPFKKVLICTVVFRY